VRYILCEGSVELYPNFLEHNRRDSQREKQSRERNAHVARLLLFGFSVP